NIYDTFHQKEKYLKKIDKVIITTDIGERDFRYILNFARRNKLTTLVFTCGEYIPQHIAEENLIILENSGIPNYHAYINEIKRILVEREFISITEVKDRDIPETGAQRSGRTVIQLLLLAAVIVLLFTGVFKLLEYISSDRVTCEADIEWAQEVEHNDSDTVETCAVLGDEYLKELKTYVDLQDEPHIFFENRTRTTFINYEINKFE